MRIEEKNIVQELGQIDLFICSSGFEMRSKKLASTLDIKKISNSIIFHLNDTYSIASENFEKIKSLLPNISVVEYPKNTSLETFDIFYNTLRKLNTDSLKLNVVVDITTFTREILLILIKVLSLNVFSNFNVSIVYTPNESYSMEKDNLWITKGIRDIRSIIGYSGLHSPSKKLLLLILNGFEEERTNHLIECFEPEKVIIGKPDQEGSINETLNLISDKKFDEIKKTNHNLIKEVFDFSCKDINKTMDSLISIIDQNEEFNIVISPLNNKVSTVAVAAVAIKNENVQVCYAAPNQYNIDAKGIASKYFLLFNLTELLK